MSRLLSKVVLISIALAVVAASKCMGQCNVGVELSNEKVADSHYAISLKPNADLKNVHLQLFDLYEGKVVKEERIGFLAANAFSEVFRQVKPSLYYVYLKFDGCERKGLGGASGYKVGDK